MGRGRNQKGSLADAPRDEIGCQRSRLEEGQDPKGWVEDTLNNANDA